MIYDVPVQNGNPVASVYQISTEGTIEVQYDISSTMYYPLLYKGQKVTSIKQEEVARQFIGPQTDIVKTISSEVDNFNIIALTLSAKVKADLFGFYSDVTLQSDGANNLYTRDGKIVENFTVKIRFENGEESILDLASHTLYQNPDAIYPSGWQIDSFGNITLTCEAF
jgi:hypothetical protein